VTTLSTVKNTQRVLEQTEVLVKPNP